MYRKYFLKIEGAVINYISSFDFAEYILRFIPVVVAV